MIILNKETVSVNLPVTEVSPPALTGVSHRDLPEGLLRYYKVNRREFTPVWKGYLSGILVAEETEAAKALKSLLGTLSSQGKSLSPDDAIVSLYAKSVIISGEVVCRWSQLQKGLACCDGEFQRRLFAKYKDQKTALNAFRKELEEAVELPVTLSGIKVIYKGNLFTETVPDTLQRVIRYEYKPPRKKEKKKATVVRIKKKHQGVTGIERLGIF